MLDLNALLVFASVIEAGSFSEASRRLTMPVSTVSRRVAELEEQLGVRLLERSTRRLRLTDAGAEVLVQARRSVEVWEAVRGIASEQIDSVAGNVRLSAPPNISDSLLAPLVHAFQAVYPDVKIQILVTERLVDLIADSVDVAFHVGSLKDSSLIVRKLLSYRHQLVASPAYLARASAPTQPSDLARHRIVAFSHWRPENQWVFRHKGDGGTDAFSFLPHLGINDFSGVTTALLLGEGIGDLPPIVQPDLLREGRLVEIMDDWHFPVFDLSLVYLANRLETRPVRLFKEFAAQMVPTLFPDLPR